MATVTFPIELGGSGLVVSDDTDPTTGLRNGGYLTRFVPALQQTVAVAGFVVGQVSNAAASASAAAGSASAASSSASSAASSAASAATLYDQFDDRYLGPKASNPTVDNDGNALLVGAMYFNTSALETRVWNGTTWQTASVNGGTVNSLIVTGDLQYQGTLTGGTGVIDIGEGQIYKDALGNVGVGTANPGSKFEVASNAADQFRVTRAGVRSFLHSVDGSGVYNISDGDNFSLTFTPAGNVGLGVPPSAWGSGYKALRIDFYGSLSSTQSDASVNLTANAYNDGTNWIYQQAGIQPTLYKGNLGSHTWFTAPSGTAGAPITFTQAMTLTQGGNLLVNITNDGLNQKVAIRGPSAGGIGVSGSDYCLALFDPTQSNYLGLNVNTISTVGGLPLILGAANIEAARLTPTGSLLVGTTADFGGRATFSGATDLEATVRIQGIGAAQPTLQLSGGAAFEFTNLSSGGVKFVQSGVGEAARITAARYFKASNTGTYFQGPTTSTHEMVSDQNAITLGVANTNTGSSVQNVRSDLPTGAAGLHFIGVLNGVSQFTVAANGDVRNTNNSYGAISDPKLKDVIGPKSSTWEKTKQYNWIEYYLKSDTEHTFKMLGLNAEEAQAVSPGVVDESPDLVEVTKVRQVPVRIVRLDENENPTVDEESGEVIYDEVMVDEEYTEWEPNGEFTKSVKYSVVSMQYHRTTQECQQRIESLEAAKVQADDLIQQIMVRVAALESASA